MIHATPKVTSQLARQLAELDSLHAKLGRDLAQPAAWMGALRRLAQTLAVESSTAIEGFHVPHDEALGLVSGTASADPSDENRMAIACYARAMDHVGAMADDPSFRWLDRVLLDLHFDACRFQRDKAPGRWRTGPIGVTGGGRIIYQAPDADDVPQLMGEVVEWLEHGDLDQHVAVRAAMAHLHVVAVHPFRDGNGRVSRIVQSLVLARDGIVAPEFASIEPYLSEHTADYYAALRTAQGDGTYDPSRDAKSWVAFCIEAHLDQARRRLAQIEQAAARWERLEQLVDARSWPDRLVIALEQALIGGTDRGRYAGEADVSFVTATGDLRRLFDAGLLQARGAGRSTRYEPSDALRAAVRGDDDAQVR
jgi:Fic family protein